MERREKMMEGIKIGTVQEGTKAEKEEMVEKDQKEDTRT